MPRLPRGAQFLLVAALTVIVPGCGSAAGSSTAADDGTAATEDAPVRDVVTAYTRFGPGPHDTELELTYAPAAFFRALQQEVPAQVEQGSATMFLLRESVHDNDDLTDDLPDVVLRRSDGELIEPESVEVITNDFHHRASRLTFAVDTSGADRIELVVTSDGQVASATVPFVWDLPIALARAELRGN